MLYGRCRLPSRCSASNSDWQICYIALTDVGRASSLFIYFSAMCNVVRSIYNFQAPVIIYTISGNWRNRPPVSLETVVDFRFSCHIKTLIFAIMPTVVRFVEVIFIYTSIVYSYKQFAC